MEVGTNELRQMQLKILDMFSIFELICKKHGLKYFLLGGSCLGAVRHQGFIPWDDDIDVGMYRKDYDKFCEIAAKELPDPLFLQTFESDIEYDIPYAKIRNTNTTYIEESSAYKKINHGVFMDVFPLDFVPEKIISKIQLRIYRAAYDNFIRYGTSNNNVIPSLKKKAAVFIGEISCNKDLRLAKRKRDELFRQAPETCKMIANYYGAWAQKEICPKEWFGEGTLMEFEGISVRIPSEWDKYLTQLYGDYMQLPPVEKRKSHHTCTVIDLEKSYKIYTEQ